MRRLNGKKNISKTSLKKNETTKNSGKKEKVSRSGTGRRKKGVSV